MSDQLLDPTTQAVKIERLENRQNSLEQLVRSSNDRLELTIRGLSAQLEKWFGEHEKNYDTWRERHEMENENANRDLSNEIRNVREKMIRYASVGLGLGMLVSVVVTGFLWTLGYRFDEQDKQIQRVEKANSYHQELIEHQTAEVTNIKLRLAKNEQR